MWAARLRHRVKPRGVACRGAGCRVSQRALSRVTRVFSTTKCARHPTRSALTVGRRDLSFEQMTTVLFAVAAMVSLGMIGMCTVGRGR